MKIKFKIELTKTQKKAYELLHDEGTRGLVCNWSRQCGKTVFAELILIETLLKNNTFSEYISPTFSQGRKVYRDIVNILEQSCPMLIKSVNASTLTIVMQNKSTLQFFSMESPSSIRGNTVRRGVCVLDECAFFPDVLPDGSDPWYNVIFPTVKAHYQHNKILIISTPSGKRGLFWKFYNQAVHPKHAHSTKTRYLHATIYDDELISKEDVEEIKNGMPEVAFKQEFLGEWLDSSLSYFTGYEDTFTDFIYDDSEANYIGIDLSSTGEDDTVITTINPKHQAKQDVIVSIDLTDKYNQIANIINNTKNLKTVYIENNGIGEPMIDSIKKLLKNPNIVKPWTTTNDSKLQICSALAIAFTDKKISLQQSNQLLYNQLGTFSYSYTKYGKLILKGIGNTHDDTVMSLAIALRALTDGNTTGQYTHNKPRVMSKISRTEKLKRKYG